MSHVKSGFRSMILAPLSLAIAIAGTALAAGDIQQVTVEASRPNKEVIGRTSMGAPIELFTVKRKVSYADLDLKTQSGAATLESRVTEAAQAACKSLDKFLPLSNAGGIGCVKATVDASMVEARSVIAAAKK